MKKIRIITTAALVVLAAGWSGLWYLGRDTVGTVLDTEIARLRAQGVGIEHGARSFGGFPFAYEVTYRDVTVRDPRNGAVYRLPQITAVADASDPRKVVVNFPASFRAEVPVDQEARDAMPELPETLLVDFETSGMDLGIAGLTGAGRDFALTATSILAVTGGKDQPLNIAIELTGVDAGLSVPPSGQSTARAVAEKVEYAYTGATQDGTVTAQGSASSLRMTGSADSFAAWTDAKAGASSMTYQTGAAEGSLDTAGSEGGSSGAITYAAGSTAGTLAIADGTAEFNASSRANRAVLVAPATAGTAPPPGLGGSIDAVEMRMRSALAAPDAVAPFSLHLVLEGARPDAALWLLIDTRGTLPRDPARLLVDLSGTRRPASGEAGAGAPFELATMSVRTAEVSLLGANVATQGDLAFPPSRQQPEGALTVTLTGALELPAKLAEAGLIDRASAAMAAMMAESFTEPGAAPGERVARIELTADGMTVNGQKFGR